MSEVLVVGLVMRLVVSGRPGGSSHGTRGLSAGPMAPATVQKAYQLLGKVMGAAVDAGMVMQSPCRRVPLP
jgi:hypothetical protein